MSDRRPANQLRLVESPPPKRPSSQRPSPGRARLTKASKGRRAHWASDWHLDAATRRAGREGVQAARAALAQAHRPASDLPRAS